MAEQVGQAGQAAVQPAVELLAEWGKEAAKEWGRVSFRINNPWVAAVGLSGIGAFYLANKALTMLAVRRAVERRDPDNPDQPADPQVGLEAEVDSLLVPVIFYSQLGYQYFTSILNSPFLKACLQTELEKISYKEPIDVSAEKWELPNLPEGGAGPLMGQEKVLGWLKTSSEKGSLLSTVAGDSGMAPSPLTSWEDVEEEEEKEDKEEEAGPSPAKQAKLQQQPPAQVTSTSQQPEHQEGPLKRLRARLHLHKDSPTAQARLKAYSCLERGAAMLTSSGYQEGEGVEHLLEGVSLMERVVPEGVNMVLYDQSWLHLDKTQLDKLIVSELQANPDSTPCLLLQALQLPHGDNRQQAIGHVIHIVRQHGETDPIYKHLSYMYYALGLTILATTKQPAPALSACASALKHQPNHVLTLYFTAWCSRDVNISMTIQHFQDYIHTAPTGHTWVPHAHYHLIILYGRQDPTVHRDKILHHYNMAQQTDRNRLPVFTSVPHWIADPARKVYEQIMAQTDK